MRMCCGPPYQMLTVWVPEVTSAAPLGCTACGNCGSPRLAVSWMVAVNGPGGLLIAWIASASSCAGVRAGSDGTDALAVAVTAAIIPTAASAPAGTAHLPRAPSLLTWSPTVIPNGPRQSPQ